MKDAVVGIGVAGLLAAGALISSSRAKPKAIKAPKPEDEVFALPAPEPTLQETIWDNLDKIGTVVGGAPAAIGAAGTALNSKRIGERAKDAVAAGLGDDAIAGFGEMTDDFDTARGDVTAFTDSWDDALRRENATVLEHVGAEFLEGLGHVTNETVNGTIDGTEAIIAAGAGTVGEIGAAFNDPDATDGDKAVAVFKSTQLVQDVAANLVVDGLGGTIVEEFVPPEKQQEATKVLDSISNFDKTVASGFDELGAAAAPEFQAIDDDFQDFGNELEAIFTPAPPPEPDPPLATEAEVQELIKAVTVARPVTDTVKEPSPITAIITQAPVPKPPVPPPAPAPDLGKNRAVVLKHVDTKGCGRSFHIRLSAKVGERHEFRLRDHRNNDAYRIKSWEYVKKYRGGGPQPRVIDDLKIRVEDGRDVELLVKIKKC